MPKWNKSGLMKLFDNPDFTEPVVLDPRLKSVDQKPFSSGYIPPSLQGAGTQSLEFEPAQITAGSKTYETPQEALAKDGATGWLGTIYHQIMKDTLDMSLLNSNDVNDYSNDFIINYHSYRAPAPIPIQTYATNVEITHATEAPYETATISLKMNFDFGVNLFAGEDGHPSPGGWILIRKKNVDVEETGQLLNFSIQDSPALFLGTISNIQWGLNTDNAGNVESIITITVSSFIHNIMYGEYRISQFKLEDQPLDGLKRLKSKGEFLSTDEARDIYEKQQYTLQTEGYASNKFIFDYAGEGGWARQFERYRNLVQGLTYNEETGTWGRPAGKQFRVPPAFVLSEMMSDLCYPVLPLSFYAEPLDIRTFLSVHGPEIINGVVPDGLLFRLTEQIPEFMVKALLEGVIYFVKAAALESPFVTEGDDGVNAQAFANLTSFNEKDIDVINTRIVKYQENVGKLSSNIPDTAYEGLRLGDILHLATTNRHVPYSSPLWAAMPHRELKDYNISSFNNIESKSKTIWGLLKGSFQTDEESLEFFPTMIPLTGRDSQAIPKEVSNKNRQQTLENNKRLGYNRTRSSLQYPHPLWAALGGIPTIVYRYKPMHPQLQGDLSKEKINKLIQEQKKYLPGLNAQELEYETMFGQTQESPEFTYDNKRGGRADEYIDNSYGDDLPAFDFSFDAIMTRHDSIENNLGREDAEREFEEALQRGASEALLDNLLRKIIVTIPIIEKDKILSVNWSQDDRLRVNATKTSEVGSSINSNLFRATLNSNYILNVDNALKHGLRVYENSLPLLSADSQRFQYSDAIEKVRDEIRKGVTDIDTLSGIFRDSASQTLQAGAPLYQRTTRHAERSYMLYGDEQKYWSGTITCMNIDSMNLVPGTWLEVQINSSGYVKNDLIGAPFMCYLKGIDHSFDVDSAGNIINTTVLNVDKVSIFGVIPNFPARKDANLERSESFLSEDFIFDTILDLLDNSSQNSNPDVVALGPQGSSAETPEHQAIAKDIDRNWTQRAYSIGNITREQYLEYLESGFPSDAYSELNTSIESAEESAGVSVKQSLKDLIIT